MSFFPIGPTNKRKTKRSVSRAQLGPPIIPSEQGRPPMKEAGKIWDSAFLL